MSYNCVPQYMQTIKVCYILLHFYETYIIYELKKTNVVILGLVFIMNIFKKMFFYITNGSMSLSSFLIKNYE
jgi:hypothetical protein